jgi:hypothetical protein
VFHFIDRIILPDNKLIVITLDDPFYLGVLSSRLHTSWAIRAGGWLGVGNDPVYVKSHCFDPFPFPLATEAQQAVIGTNAEEIDAHRKRVQAEHPNLTLTGIYNVLEKLRSGTAPSSLEGDDRRIFDDGLVLILKELHDRLDAAVAESYGWPVDLSDDEILARLVALNKERAAEEKRGLVRWLRPDYQIPRFGKPEQKAEQIEAELGTAETKAAKPLFPAEDVAQTAAVMAALAASAGPLDAASLTAGFRQGRRIEAKIAATLAALARMGFIATPDGGKTFLLRRAS